MDNYIVFPIEVVRKVEPLLDECFSFERSMIHSNLHAIYNIYAGNCGQYSKEEEEFYLLNPPKHKSVSEILKSAYVDFSAEQDCAMNVGKNMLFNLGKYSFDEIKELFISYLDETAIDGKSHSNCPPSSHLK